METYEKSCRRSGGRRRGGTPSLRGRWLWASGVCLAVTWTLAAGRPPETRDEDPDAGTPSLEETRIVMGKWIETQQIISRERKEWQQGKEILQGRVDLLRKEVATLESAVQAADGAAVETEKKKTELAEQLTLVEATGRNLESALDELESDVRRLCRSLPVPIQARVQPLRDRMPEDKAKSRVSIAERFQNVIGILNEVNKANSELVVNFEIHTNAAGVASEVQALYVGLAQAYYVNANNEAGVGKPTADGWQWSSVPNLAGDVARALEIMQGKQTPAFVSLPIGIQ